MSKIADLILAAGEISADMRYASGFAAPDSHLYFRTDAGRFVLVSALEFDRARASVHPGVEVLDAGRFGTSFPEQVAVFAKTHKISSFRVPSDFPLFAADKIRARGFRVEPQEGAFLPEREFKSAAERDAVVRALRIAENAVRKAVETIAACSVDGDGRLTLQGECFTSEALRAVIELDMTAHGAQMPAGTIAAGYLQSAEPHNAGSGPLYAGTPIVMDVFPRMSDTGYWGDLTRTVCKGKPRSERYLPAFEAVRRARDEAEKIIRPGVNPAEVHYFAKAILDKAGFPTGRRPDGRNYGFFHGLGHGVGLDIHEAPRLSPANTRPLAGGEIITVEPGVYEPEWGGIRLEDMVYVTPDGAKLLTDLATEPVVE